MDRRRKLSDEAIRQIFKSKETSSVLGRRFRISEQMIYLIRSGRAHGRITSGLQKGIAGSRSMSTLTKADIAALADAIIDRLVRRLARRDTKPRKARTKGRARAESLPSREAA